MRLLLTLLLAAPMMGWAQGHNDALGLKTAPYSTLEVQEMLRSHNFYSVRMPSGFYTDGHVSSTSPYPMNPFEPSMTLESCERLAKDKHGACLEVKIAPGFSR